MRYAFQLCTLLLCAASALPVSAETRIISGDITNGIFDTYGDLESSGTTTVKSGSEVIYQTLGETTLKAEFSVEQGAVLRFRSLAGPDWPAWKSLYFNSNEVDMMADPDLDGLTNLAELKLGTNPTVADGTLTDTDNDGLADSWEIQHYGSLAYQGADDPETDGTSVLAEYREFLDYHYNTDFLYLEGTLASTRYSAREVHSRGATLVPAGTVTQVVKAGNAKLYPDFKVRSGGTFIIYSHRDSSVNVAPPAPPSGIKASFPGTSISLSWTENGELDISGYNLYRDGQKLNSNPLTTTSFNDTGPVHGTSYVYHATAIDKAGKESEPSSSLSLTADIIPPNLISRYPAPGTSIATQGEPLTVIGVFGDDGSGVASITVTGNGEDLTGRAVVKGNSFELLLLNPASGQHNYTVKVMDHGQNALTVPFTFTVDATLLKTTADVPGGDYSATLSVDLVASKAATIHYSTDGYPPVIGMSPSGPSPITGIPISQNTSLQFFAVDGNGNREVTRNEVYRFDKMLPETTGLTVQYQETAGHVILSWTPIDSLPVQGYKIYRCANPVECKVLAQSRTGKYQPPERFSITSSPVATSSLTDSDVTAGEKLSYGVLVIDQHGNPGNLSPLVSAQITADSIAATISEAADRAFAWLYANQDTAGYWGDAKELRILGTSQILNAFAVASKGTPASTDAALFYLRGRHADNNDYLARRVLTLSGYNQNVDQELARLIARANIHQSAIYGWGITNQYAYDALDTSLGLLAVLRSPVTISDNQSRLLLLTEPSLFSSDGSGHYGWIAGGPTSIYVSSLVHFAIEQASGSTLPDRQWIFGAQLANGSFNDSIVDTAAVLLWLATSDITRLNAASYLLARQKINGSWEDDPYLTGLCLEALYKGL